MKVLVACEFSGVVRDAFANRGHDAWSCDLLPTESEQTRKEGKHIQGDVLGILNDGWDLMIAHPPCTYLSNAGACRLYPKKGQVDIVRFAKGILAKEFFLALLNASIKRVCVENPVPSRIFNMPPHSQEIQPYMFGHPVSKKTRLWLRDLPPLMATNLVRKEGPYCPAGTGRKDRRTYGAAKRGQNEKARSITFPGIARAMAEQWG